MAIAPRFKIYNSTGLALLHTFEAVNDTNIPHDPQKSIVTSNFRNTGAIVRDGGTEAWELFVTGSILGDDYEDLVSKTDTMIAAIPKFTKLLFKVEYGAVVQYGPYNVMRIVPIELPVESDLRTYFQDYTARFLVNTWI